MAAVEFPVAIDGRLLDVPEATGVAHYAKALRAALPRLTEAPGVISACDASARSGRIVRWIRAASPKPRRAVVRAAAPLIDFHIADLYRIAQVHFDIYRRPLAIELPGPPGIVHWSYPLPIAARGWANLYTIHDMIPFEAPDLTPINEPRHRRLLKQVAAHATAIVTVSQASRAAIGATLDYPLTRVFDCGEAVEVKAEMTAALPDGLSADGYFLVVGTVERRKNIDRLITAHSQAATGLPLVIVGATGWQAPPTSAPGVRRLPYLPTDVVRALMRYARALLMPSLAEGFGLPIVEAMALGTPVLTSRGGALEEVAGGSALLIDPYDVAALSKALKDLATDDDLRARLSDAGRRNAARFDAATFEARLAETYRAAWALRDQPLS